MAHAGYVRVSTADQNEARQVEALSKYKIDKWFKEKISGKNLNRPELRQMMDWVRDGDTVYIEDFSRLARSTKDLLELVDLLTNKGVHLVSLKESLDTSTPSGKLMLTMIGAINEFERENILERQAEGIALAKQKGVYTGRQKIVIKNFDDLYNAYIHREISKSGIAKKLKISRPTVDRLIREEKEKLDTQQVNGKNL